MKWVLYTLITVLWCFFLCDSRCTKAFRSAIQCNDPGITTDTSVTAIGTSIDTTSSTTRFNSSSDGSGTNNTVLTNPGTRADTFATRAGTADDPTFPTLSSRVPFCLEPGDGSEAAYADGWKSNRERRWFV